MSWLHDEVADLADDYEARDDREVEPPTGTSVAEDLRDLLDSEPEPADGKCESLHRQVLHRNDDVVVYLRCKKGHGHPGKNHEHRWSKWTDDDEDGQLC